jgi:hypothetical protein
MGLEFSHRFKKKNLSLLFTLRQAFSVNPAGKMLGIKMNSNDQDNQGLQYGFCSVCFIAADWIVACGISTPAGTACIAEQ